MHICHVAGALRGGPLTSIRHLTKYQLHAGHRITVIYSPIRDSREELRAALPSAVDLVPWAVGRNITLRDLRSLFELHGILKGLSPDILHLHSSKAGFHGRLVAKILGLPNVYSPRGLSYLRDDVSAARRIAYRTIERAAAAFGGPVVACSEGEYVALKEVSNTIYLIPNGIDLTDPALMPNGARVEHNDVNRFLVMFAGRITPQRAPVRAVAIAAAAPPNWRFQWIGDGELRHVVEGSRIEILGWQSREVALDRMSRADVLLHPSLWEGMPNAVLEAMALGVPVVASDIVGNRSLVRDGETGFLVRNDRDYLPILKRLADDLELRNALGAAGRARISNLFDLTLVARRWEELYHGVSAITASASGQSGKGSG